MIQYRTVAMLSLVFTMFAGCGGGDTRPAIYPVSGTINFDGQPLAEASIIFEPETIGDPSTGAYSRSSNAVTDAQGVFQVSTFTTNDGMPAGKYKVAVVKQSRKTPPGMDPEMATPEQLAKVVVKDLIPTKYSSMATSGLVVEVTSTGLQPNVIELTSK